MGFRRPVRPVIPGERCPATRTNKSSDPKVTITDTTNSGRRGIRDCGRCGAKGVVVHQSGNGFNGGATTAWNYAAHIAPIAERTDSRP